MKKVALLLLLLFIGVISFSQGLQDTIIRIKGITVTAERLFKKEEAGMKETKVDSLVLLEKINLSLSELLSENTMVFIKSHGRGALATASFRGTAASHTQVNWNGININSPMTGMVDFSLIPVYIIDILNLKHGVASIADRTGALGGSIDINNQADWDNKFSLKYLQGIGSYSTYDEFLSVGIGNKKIQVRTRLYHNYSKNDYTFINHGIPEIDPKTEEIVYPLDTTKNASYKKYGMLQEIYFRLDTNNIFSAKYQGQLADRAIPTATTYEGPETSNKNNQIDNDHKLMVDWKYYTPKSKWIVRSGFTHRQLDYTLKNHIPGLGEIPAIYSQSTEKSSLNKLNYHYSFNDKLSIESSLNFNYYQVASRDSVKKTGYEKQRKEFSLFMAIRKNFADRLNLNLMFHQDWVDKDFSPFVSFFGFDYRIFKDIDFLFKGNIARNHHQPSLNDLYWQPGGNPNLLTEEGIGGEIGLEYQKIFNKQYLLKTELTTYWSDIDNWIIWIPSYKKGYWEPFNIKRVLSKGVEFNLSLEGKIRDFNFQFSGNYAYTSSINYGDPLVWGDASYKKQLVYIPLHSGNMLINLGYRNFYLTYQHNSYSERFTTSSNDFSRRDWLYPYFLNDLIVGKEFHLKKIKITTELKIYNLFNETYHSILYRPMPKRNYLLLLIFNI